MTVLDNSNIEDMKLGQFMDEVRTNTFAEEEEILKKLTEK